jgi:hypothetical protein
LVNRWEFGGILTGSYRAVIIPPLSANKISTL